MNRIRRLAVLMALLTLAACGDDVDDVRAFVKNAHADRKPQVQPLPDFKTQETFSYSAANLTDPFASLNLRPKTTSTGGLSGGPNPDDRRKEPLEEFPLDSLKMVGTMSRGKQSWAIIQAPDGSVHRTKEGDHAGQNYGQIVKISDDRIDLIELVSGPHGDWVEREASLALTE